MTDRRTYQDYGHPQLPLANTGLEIDGWDKFHPGGPLSPPPLSSVPDNFLNGNDGFAIRNSVRLF